jgi:hypothetical protein
MRKLKLWIVHHPYLTRFIINELICVIIFALCVGIYHFCINSFTLKEIVILFLGYHVLLYILGNN